MKKLSILILMTLALHSCTAKVNQYNVKAVKEYPHDTSSYTQGLFFNGGRFYESTGQWGESTMRVIDLESGGALHKLAFDDKYFVEGSVILGDKLYILTWTNKVAFVYDANTLEYIKTYSYPKEGWGLTTDGKQLIASDGSSRLYFLDEDLKLKKTVNVTRDSHPVRYLNELEYIDGKIWANVYTTDLIVIIDPKSGKVEATVDCSGLLPDKLRTSRTDVLNGIAKDPGTGKIYLTGKYWPKLYEIELISVR